MSNNKILEDWLTFQFTNIRLGNYHWDCDYNVKLSSINEWKPRIYCLSCGALWSMIIDHKKYCLECGSRQLKMLVCRAKEVITVKKIPIIWYKPSTWKGYVEEKKNVWEYRLKQSETGLEL